MKMKSDSVKMKLVFRIYYRDFNISLCMVGIEDIKIQGK